MPRHISSESIRYEDTIPDSNIPIGTDPTTGFEIVDFNEKDNYKTYKMVEVDNPSNVRELSLAKGESHLESLTPMESYELTEHDKEVITIGVKRLASYLSSQNTLPQTVIFPDSSARLLFWAVKDTLEVAYKQKNLSKPFISFFACDAHAIAERAKEVYRIDPLESTKSAEMLKNNVDALVRAGIVKEGNKVLVIDDYVSSSGDSYNALGAEVKKRLNPGDLTWFSFLSHTDTEEEEDMVIAHREDTNRSRIERTGFDYAATPIQKLNTTGVDKYSAAVPINPAAGTLYSSRGLHSDEINREIATGIREDLQELGAKLAKEVK